MNPDTLIELLQKGFRVTLGATSTLIESIQDPQRRDEALEKLRGDLGELAEELAQKGEMTEREARNFVETIMNQQTSSSGSSDSTSYSSAAPSPSTTPDVQADLQDLTEQIAAIREKLEKLREQDP